MKNISSVEGYDPIEMRVIYHARKMYVSNLIKAMLLIMILGLMSLFSKVWAQVSTERIEAINHESTAEGKRVLAEWRSWYFGQRLKPAADATVEVNNAGITTEYTDGQKDYQYYLSIAQNMVSKSLHVDDPSLQGLMAQQTYLFNEYGRFRVIKTTPDDRWIIVGTEASSIYCFDQQSYNRKSLIIKGHTGSIIDMAVLQDNRYFVSLSDDNTLRINDLKYGRGKLMKKLNESYVKLAISPDGRKLALASGNGKLIVIDMKNADQENVILPAGGPVIRSITFSPAGDKVVIGNTQGIVKMIDLSIDPWLVFTELRGHNTGTHITDVAFSEDGTFFASGGFDGTILLWDMNNLNKLPVTLRDNSARVWSLAFSHNNDYLYAGCEDGSIKVWSTRTESMSNLLLGKLTKNMTREEWLRYAYEDLNIPYAQSLLSVNP
ncbi:MAG TPA: hypothetical protein VI583_05155 [Cyclobacteriaceae bacterium]|nr:hypothetical protein [Cyclobacteriaceae bacterium]